MKRMVRAIVMFLAGVMLAQGGPAFGAGARPNIIFILTDDLGYGDLGCYGQKVVPTPNIDRIAAEGTRFTNAYAGNNCCAPSRCSLLTGLHPGHATVRNNGGSLGADDVTVAAVLRKAGYATAAFGKWHLGAIGSAGDPNAQGFELYYGIDPKSGGSETHFNPVHYRNGQPVTIAANQDGAKGAFGDDLFLEEALKYIREKRDKPFFIYLALRTIHKPLEVPEDSMKEWAGKFEEKPFKGDGQVGECPMPKAARAAMMTRMDRNLPRLFAALKEMGQDKNTLVLFAGDNGPANAGGADPVFFNSAGGLRGLKFSMWEGGIRVPMIAWWPGTVPAGKTCDLPLAFWDFMPTFAELGGAECPKTDGLSLLPALKGDLAKQKIHDYFYWERSGEQAVRAGDVKARTEGGEGGPMSLFNLKENPAEAQEKALKSEAMETKIRGIMKEAHVDEKNGGEAGKDGKKGKNGNKGKDGKKGKKRKQQEE